MAKNRIYGASKGALQTLIRTLTRELLGRGIRVNAPSAPAPRNANASR